MPMSISAWTSTSTLSMIMPDPTTGYSQAHCAIGRIRYPECPGRPNWLIYMKNSMTGNEPAPILNYKRKATAFPHESDGRSVFRRRPVRVVSGAWRSHRRRDIRAMGAEP